MGMRHSILIASALGAVAASGCEPAATPSQVASPDRIELPAVRRVFASASGRAVFTVTAVDAWKTPAATGELSVIEGATSTRRWHRELPQEYGPRFVLVTDGGTVAMLDEWINVHSPEAVLIIDSENRVVAQHSTDVIQEALGVPMNEIVRMAAHGWWIASPPVLASSGESVVVESAGKRLRIRLADGALSVD